jgi:hypothetical protein
MDSPVPQLLPPTVGDTVGVSPAAPQQGNYSLPVPQVTYGEAPGFTPGVVVNTHQIVPPDMTHVTPGT